MKKYWQIIMVALLVSVTLSAQTVKPDSTLYKKYVADLNFAQSRIPTSEKAITELEEKIHQSNGSLLYITEAWKEQNTLLQKGTIKDSILFKKYAADFNKLQNEAPYNSYNLQLMKEEVGKGRGIILYLQAELQRLEADFKKQAAAPKK